jgi:hypothetical protein
MTYNIVTSVAVDVDEHGGGVLYPSLGSSSDRERRNIYWKCAAVCCWISRATNPTRRHAVYTNDTLRPVVDGLDIADFFKRNEVDLVYMPFESDPRDNAKLFRNAFYKFDVIRAVSELSEPSIVIDSDVVWHSHSDDLDHLVCRGEKLLLQDTYQRNSRPDVPEPHGLSMRAMGDAYRQIDPSYPEATPVWWGGELIAGGPDLLSRVADGFARAMPRFIEAAPHLRFTEQNGILDNDEYLSSFVYNQLDVEIVDTYRRFSRRIGTLPGRADAWQGDTEVPIWHLLNEKRRGFEILFGELRRQPVPFDRWSTGHRPLGDYFGIPRPGESRAWRHRVWRLQDIRLELESRWNVRRNPVWNPN